jgi:hypothetical protein
MGVIKSVAAASIHRCGQLPLSISNSRVYYYYCYYYCYYYSSAYRSDLLHTRSCTDRQGARWALAFCPS